MKKKVFMMLPCIAAVAIATIVGKRTLGLNANDTSSLLIQNVEALSQGGADDLGGDDDDPCAIGLTHYSRTATTSGKVEVVSHYIDGSNGSKGIDEVYTISFTGCVADGSGSLKGANYSIPGDKGTSSFQECEGPQGHKFPEFP